MSQLSPNAQHTKSPPTLPDELWAYIGRLLLESDLARSCSISPIFFDLWMKTVFTEVKICSMKDQGTLRVLCTMTAVAARYVSKLTLCPQFFQLREANSSVSRLINQPQAVSLTNKLKGLLSAEKIPKSVAVQALLYKIAQMRNVKTVVVECISNDEARLFGNIAAFLDVIRVHAGQLENLEINVPMKCLGEVLRAIPRCAALQSLSLTFEGDRDKDAARGEALWSKTANLINLHSATLRRIVISTARVGYDFLPIFSGVRHLPNLTEASFLLYADYFTPQHKGSVSLEAFLKAHAKQLRGLELCSVGPFIHTESVHPLLFHHPLFQIDFPALTRLGFALNSRGYYPNQLAMEPPIADLLSKYLTQYRGSLQQLAILTRVLSFSEVQAVCSALGEKGSALTSLHVKIESFDADILTLLARSFPNLDNLGLGHPYLCSTAPTDDTMLPVKCNAFVESLSNCDSTLGQWRLRHLHVYVHEHLCWGDTEALLAGLPYLATINGYSRRQAMAVKHMTSVKVV